MANVERDLPEHSGQTERVTLDGLSIGTYKPERFITNQQFEQWGIRTQSGNLITASSIDEKIGIKRRFRAGLRESVIDMGVQAAIATGDLNNIDAVIVTSSYPVGINLSKETSTQLKIEPCSNLDIHWACSGLVKGLTFMKEHKGQFEGKKVLLVATELYSLTLADLRNGGISTDPSMAQLIFSDGAVAMVFKFGEDIQVKEYANVKLPAELDRHLRMPIDPNLMVEPFIYGPIPNSSSGLLEQDGPKVFRAILSYVPKLNYELVEKAGLTPNDINLVIPHQASGRMVKGLVDNMPDFNLFEDLEDGNFSSASIPKALARAILEGKVQSGDKLLLSSFGAGLYTSNAVVEIG